VLTRIAEQRLSRRRGAALLGLSERQVRRLYEAFTQAGAAGLASRRRGRPSNRRLADTTREEALGLLRERSADFGPTFAHQKMSMFSACRTRPNCGVTPGHGQRSQQWNP
jgi:hypothetical protein